MEQQLNNLSLQLRLINDTISRFSVAFYKNYDFWLGLLSIIVLSITLLYLIKYTKATQEMKNEMVKQGKMSNAYDIYFDMGSNFYLSANPYDKQIFGKLTTPISIHTISEFLFLGENLKPIGRQTDFLKIIDGAKELVADYRIENKNDRVLFITTLCNKRGLIKARVMTTSGDKFIYTYKAVTENYKKAKETPNLSDSFRLIKKIVI